MPATRSRGESCGTPPSRSTTWFAGSRSTARRGFRCSAVSHRRCSPGWRRMCNAGWCRWRAMRWTAPCISPGERSIRNDEGVVMRTEQIDPRYADLDSWSAAEMIAAMYEGQLAAAGAVRGALGAVAAAVEDAVPALRRGGRIVYVGAGTSARIGVQDGSELLPTYDWPADRVVFVIAGGLDALVRSIEGAEDNEAAGMEAIVNAKIGDDRPREQRGRADFPGGAPPDSGRNRKRSDRRINADERRHRAEDRSQPLFDRGDGKDGPGLSRPDGGYESAERQVAPPRRRYRQANCRLRGRRRGTPSRAGGRRPEDSHPAWLWADPRRGRGVAQAAQRQSARRDRCVQTWRPLNRRAQAQWR